MPCAVASDAVYSWWVHPLVVNDQQAGVTWVGSVDASGLSQIHRVVCATGVVDTVDLDGPGQVDDHNAAAIAFDPARADLLAFYSRHNSDSHVRYQTVNRSTLALGTQQTVSFTGDVTYAQVLQLGDRLVLLCRATAGRWAYRVSDDFGVTWGAEQELITGPAIYVAARPDPTDPETVHIGVSGHPVSSSYHNVGYLRLNLATGDLTSGTDPAVLGNLADAGGPQLTEADIDQAYVAGVGESTRLLDVGITAAGVPALAYAVWDAPLGPPVYRVQTLVGGVWTADIWSLASGEPFGFDPETRYLAGMALGREGAVGTLRTSRQEPSGQWVVERWTRQGGDNWTLAAEEDRSPTRLIRPYSAYRAGPVEWTIQRVSTYNFYTSYLGNVEVYAPPAVSPVPPGGLPQRAQATIRTRVTWLACDAVTGRKIAELQDARASVERVLNSYTSADVVIPLPTGGPGHVLPPILERATQPIRSMLVLVVNDVPSWAGWVRDRVGGSDAELHVPCVTLEGYLRERVIQGHEWVQQDVASVIAAGLAADAGDVAGVGSGIGLTIDAPPSGILRDRTYVASDRQVVYDGLRELAGTGLVEWTIDLDWQDAQKKQVVEAILRIRARIGVAAAVPKARFATRSSAEARYRLAEDHTSGRYANLVIAYGPGEGDDQPASATVLDQTALDAGVPIVELHYQPDASLAEQAALDEHATRRLAEVRHGAMVWELSSRWDQYPRLNIDWAVGDTIGLDIVGHRHPGGTSAVARAIGWALDTQAGLVSPRLLDPISDPEAVAG